MQYKINEKILSIPPYVSTSWSQIASLRLKGTNLIVTLVDGDTITIPNLPSETIELIFNCHAVHLENEDLSPSKTSSNLPSIKDSSIDPVVRLAFGPMDGLGMVMQHNPAQANAPDLPPDLLHKISSIAKILGPGEELLIPKAEPSCNCFHCQIARAIHTTTPSFEEHHHDEVPDIELQFQQWDIMQTGDQLFSVTNRLDNHEKYSVFLGEPVGCTCGKQGCEHILAVLKS